MKTYIEQGKQVLNLLTVKTAQEFSSGLRVVKDVVSGLPVWVSLERTKKYKVQYDEKHYFVIPFALSETGFTLHTMRCLPEAVHEVNELPKRRIFHFPNEHYEGTLRKYMIECAKEMSQENLGANKSTLENLADSIDSLDSKLTYGMLLVGGVAAIFNPLVGAGIAAKALVPGFGGLFNKYGLRPLGQKHSKAQAQKAARQAEESVIRQFSEANTIKVVNPILQELEWALRTTEEEHDPLIDPNLGNGTIPELDSERWRELTEKSIYHVYREIYKNKTMHEKASLGPEDIRWLEVMFCPYEGNRSG